MTNLQRVFEWARLLDEHYLGCLEEVAEVLFLDQCGLCESEDGTGSP